jgi:CheY-like chemotaxis protein
MTNATADSVRFAERPAVPATMTQKVVIINGSAEILALLETVLDAGHYDVVFVESTAHAYSQIKRVQPDLAILCVRMDDAEGLRVLSMLKLDADTRAIPILTYTAENQNEPSEQEIAEPADNEMFTPKPAIWMN